ncbi:MAG: hypothetical protein AAGI12_08355 [Pseudomonadota bacterium]
MERAIKSYRRSTVKHRLGQAVAPYPLTEEAAAPNIITTKGLACGVVDVHMDMSPRQENENFGWLWQLVRKINAQKRPVVSLYLSGFDLDFFYRWGLPFVRKKLVLVTGDCDNDVDANYRFGHPLRSSKVLALHAQNLDFDHPMAKPFPIGLDFHTSYKGNLHSWTPGVSPSPKQQEQDLLAIRDRAAPFQQRTHGTVVSFSVGTNIPVRNACAVRLKQVPSSYFPSKPVPREEFWALMASYQFVASPLGCGFDCHRTWEALALGAVPIIRRKPLMSPLFEDLPVWEVDDYRQVTPKSLRAKEQEVVQGLRDGRYNFEKLTVSYWRDDVAQTVEALLAADELRPYAPVSNTTNASETASSLRQI